MKTFINIKKCLKDWIQNDLAGHYLISYRIRKRILGIFGHSINGTVSSKCFFGYGKGKLTVGENTSINYKCFFDLGDNITIGNNCNISYQVTFINSTHEIGDSQQRAGKGKALPIIIEDGCWIGANVSIMPGVTIGKGCIIGAGSIVTRNCEQNGIYVGSPAKRIKTTH